MKYYTGIGSRETPKGILTIMTTLATKLEGKGYILRSGGADGADTAFEIGVTSPQMKNIYLPWKGFNNNPSPLHQIPPQCFELAEAIHPAWGRCSHGVRKLHARNTQQILGTYLDTPSKFVVCWTPDGLPVGGTATAINLAIANDIEVINLGSPKGLARILQFITT
jgi:hypothetical protein